MFKRNLAIALTMLMGAPMLKGMDKAITAVQAAAAVAEGKDRALFRQILEAGTVDLNVLVVKEPEMELMPLWQFIRETHANSPWIDDLHEFEAKMNDSLEVQLCKACADLDASRVKALFAKPDVDINCSLREEILNPLKFLLRHSPLILATIKDESDEIQVDLMNRGKQIINLLIKYCPTDVIKCCDHEHANNGPLHMAVTSPHLLKILLNACDTGAIKLDVCGNNSNMCSPLKLAAGCNLESLELLAAHPEYEKRFGTFAFNGAVTMPITSELPGTIKREMLYCLADHGASMDCTIGGKTLLGHMLQLRAHANPDAADLDRAIVIYGLLALGASLKMAQGFGADQYLDLMSYEAGQVATIPNAINIKDITQRQFTTFCRRHACYENRFAQLCLDHYAYPASGKATDWLSSLQMFAQRVLNVKLNVTDIINAWDTYGLTPLMWAAARGDEELVEELLEMPGIDGSATDSRGNTALHYACRSGHGAVIWQLLKHDSISIPTKNNSGVSAMQLAAYRGKRDFFEELRERRYAFLLHYLHEGQVYWLPREICVKIAEYLHLGDAPKSEAQKALEQSKQ